MRGETVGETVGEICTAEPGSELELFGNFGKTPKHGIYRLQLTTVRKCKG